MKYLVESQIFLIRCITIKLIRQNWFHPTLGETSIRTPRIFLHLYLLDPNQLEVAPMLWPMPSRKKDAST